MPNTSKPEHAPPETLSEFDELFERIESSSKGAESLFNANTEQLQETFHPEGRPSVSQEKQADDEPST
ncbi:hypothetical protein [Pseudoalteromonas spongiae]|uniref:hypothetical protein n=1 Tax=Pseudoalteromonas spongiae TaxID=298657 RepID=UPI00110A6D5C|nr:hypothetical protein [Pseudoalteromonas spongiae]TMO84436.1 hypothetical protein CWC15_10840 [Pseudoalteromonas spongiae]